MEERFDPTPLPPARPPTVEVRQQARKAKAPRRGFFRAGFLGLTLLFSLVVAATALLLSLEAYHDAREALAESRDEAASLRRVLFRTEDDLLRLKEAQRRATAQEIERARPPIPPTKD